MPNLLDSEELYESIVLGNHRSPEGITITGHDREIGWDVKKGSGQKGASLERTSEAPIRFKIMWHLVEFEDFEAWDNFRPVILGTVSGPDPKAVDIFHPYLAEVGIKSIVEAKILGRVPDGMGGEFVGAEFLEYLPPQKKGGSPKGSSASASTKTSRAPDPNQAKLDELKRLTDEYNKTPWG